MSARPPLLTSLGATTLLAALWFVPSANATAPESAAPASVAPASGNAGGSGTVTVTAARADGAGDTDSAGVTDATGAAGTADADGAAPGSRAATLALADTGGIDTTPYLLAGTLFLGVGAGFVAFSVRRTRAQ
ncbi:LPXTG cell wall anchor domain-containing protein [Streptomyces sp. NPDC090445]|uniref:LPXTG cell wall anchor domain-containing protein n=1 Tax=Streptomyces sp. NPDC090445 TaxID=3365963 RepID=UPI00380CBB49